MPAALRHRHDRAGIARNIIGFLGAASLLLSAWAMAEDNTRLQDIDARYQKERAACESAPPSQDHAACLREAAAARDAAKRGQLDDAQSNYQQNAQARCDALPAEERELCLRRARGEGEMKGSVSEGGIYREYREFTLPGTTPQDGAGTR